MAWVLFTLLAAFMQTFRNALQSNLSQHVNTLGVTLARFIFAAPIALAYLGALYFYQPQDIPQFETSFWLYVVIASAMQIIATALMVILFKQQNFAIGAGLAKSEALVAAILGALFFGSQLSFIGAIGVFIGGIAVFILSGINNRSQFSIKTVLIGLACGSCFALTSLCVREASQTLSIPFPHSAAWVLLWVLTIQTLSLCAYIGLTKPVIFAQLTANLKSTFAISTTSCIGSIGWFSAMSLQYVAYVKTLGQVEVLFTILIAIFWLKQPVKRHEYIGLGLISLAAVLVMWQP